MDSLGGSRNFERFIAFNLEKPPSNDLGSDTIYQRTVRPASRPRLLHLFPLTPADEPSKKKRFFRQGLPISEHNPAADLPRKCENFIPFSPKQVPHDWGSDTDPLRVRPMLLCMFPLTPADGEERRQADQGKDVINRSDSNGLGSRTQNLCASPSLEETTSGHPFRSVQFVDPSDISPRETDKHLLAPTEVPHFGPEPTNLSNGREVVPLETESMEFLNWVSGENVPYGSGCPISCPASIQNKSHLTRRLRTVICAQPTRAMSNNNTRLLAQSPAQSVQPPAQPLAQARALAPAQTRVLPRAQPLFQTPALCQALSPAQTRVPPPAQPWALSPAQLRALPLTEPRARRQAQPRVQSPTLRQALSPAQTRVPPPAQPRALSPAQPRTLPLTEPRARRQAQPRVQSPAQPRAQAPAQPRVQPQAQPGAQARTQPRARRGARPQVQAPALARAQHGPRPKSSPYKGVTHYKRTGRWEANIWDGYQIYLGASLTAIQAARAYDKAAIRFRGVNAEINFLLADYRSELPRLQAITKDELVTILREQSAGKGTLYPEYPNP